MLLAPAPQSIPNTASTGENKASANPALQLSGGQTIGVHPAVVAGASLSGGTSVGAPRRLIRTGQR